MLKTKAEQGQAVAVACGRGQRGGERRGGRRGAFFSLRTTTLCLVLYADSRFGPSKGERGAYSATGAVSRRGVIGSELRRLAGARDV